MTRLALVSITPVFRNTVLIHNHVTGKITCKLTQKKTNKDLLCDIDAPSWCKKPVLY